MFTSLLISSMLLFAQQPIALPKNDEYIAQIKRFEDRFARCRMLYDVSSYTYKSFSTGAPEHTPSPGEKLTVSYYADGERYRADNDMLLKTGGHEFHRLVTDGNTRSSWIYTSSDPRGQAVVDLLKEGATPEFNTREFRPFWSYCLQNKHAAEPSFSKETATVRAVWEETPTHHYELSLAAWRDMLRPVIIKSIYTNAGSADEIAYECRYVYSSKIGEEGLFYPARIEMLSPAHDICTVLTIREVDFSPTFTDATFQLKGFPAGTLVRDKVKNK